MLCAFPLWNNTGQLYMYIYHLSPVPSPHRSGSSQSTKLSSLLNYHSRGRTLAGFCSETPGLLIKGDSYLKPCRLCVHTQCSALPEGLGAQLSRLSCGRKCVSQWLQIVWIHVCTWHQETHKAKMTRTCWKYSSPRPRAQKLRFISSLNPLKGPVRWALLVHFIDKKSEMRGFSNLSKITRCGKLPQTQMAHVMPMNGTALI